MKITDTGIIIPGMTVSEILTGYRKIVLLETTVSIKDAVGLSTVYYGKAKLVR